MKIKICGLFRDCDIDFANEAMPDYVGFVFAKSKRQVTAKQAMQMKNRLNKQIKAVGVFVNEEILFINELIEKNVIDMAQLHGTENQEYISQIKTPVIKVVRLGEALPKNADYILFDSINAGSGTVFDWRKIPKTDKPFFLAGGIDLENIDEAIKITPYGIDVSSGVETQGFKDEQKIIELVRRVKNV